MKTVALLCNGTSLPDKIYTQDIIVRVNKGIPRKDKRTHKCVECKKETDIVKKKNIISPLIKVNCTGFVGKIEK